MDGEQQAAADVNLDGIKVLDMTYYKRVLSLHHSTRSDDTLLTHLIFLRLCSPAARRPPGCAC